MMFGQFIYNFDLDVQELFQKLKKYNEKNQTNLMS